MSESLTKREVIATKAMQGILSSLSDQGQISAFETISKEQKLPVANLIATMAVKQADALIEELAKDHVVGK